MRFLREFLTQLNDGKSFKVASAARHIVQAPDNTLNEARLGDTIRTMQRNSGTFRTVW